ncbi:MAG: AbrB/MazE/SpoVT family DNA-binding domain-containing protein [Treponema sp.]|nr:AbrB/MazE/SpoVT family DNA-binding domain-containing protein [Treponema sp.]
MLVPVVPIGNSKGIRLPKAIIEQLNISDELALEVKNQQIILKPVQSKTRKGWIQAFQQMSQDIHDELLMDDAVENEAFEWEW